MNLDRNIVKEEKLASMYVDNKRRTSSPDTTLEPRIDVTSDQSSDVLLCAKA